MKLIPLSKQGKNKGKFFTKVDDEDFILLNKWNWYAHFRRGYWYATRNEKTESGKIISVSMHRFLLGVYDETEVDHIDHDTLNNQRYNIRKAKHCENARNRSARGVSVYLGVYPDGLKWKSRIKKDKKEHYLGAFSNEIEAAKAYDEKAKELFGEFANLNFK